MGVTPRPRQYYNARVWKWSYFPTFSLLIFLLYFFPFYWQVKKRYDSTAKLWRELPTGAELAARPNEAEPNQQVTLTWKSFEILDFLIFLYGRKKLTSKEFARYFCLLFVLFYIFSQWSSTEHAPCPLKDTRSYTLVLKWGEGRIWQFYDP